MLAHPAASNPANISPTCPNVSAAKRVCACPIDAHQLHCIVDKSGGGVDQRNSAMARCLAELITTHTGTKAARHAPLHLVSAAALTVILRVDTVFGSSAETSRSHPHEPCA